MKIHRKLIFLLFAACSVLKSPASLFCAEPKSSILNFLELYGEVQFSTPKDAYKKDDLSLTTFSAVYGARLSLSGIDARFYQKHSAVNFRELNQNGFFQTFSDARKEPAWSFELNAEKLNVPNKIPLRFSAGSLSYSKCISRLKNPSFYTVTRPFFQTCVFNDGIGITAAQKMAPERPVSFASSYKDKKICVQTALFTDGNFYSSFSCKTQPGDFFKLNMLFSASRFSVSAKQSDSWKLEKPLFTTQNNFAFYTELFAAVPLFAAKFSFGAIENPFNAFRFFWTAEGNFHLSCFSLGAAFFASDALFSKEKEPFFTVSNDAEKMIFQCKLNPQVEYISPSGFSIKIGAAALYESKFDKTGYSKTVKKTFDTVPGVSVSAGKNKIEVQCKIQDILGENPACEPSAKYTRRFSALSLAFSGKFKFYPSEHCSDPKKSAGFNIYLYPKKFPVYSVSCAASVEKTKTGVTPALNLGISARFNAGKTKIAAKIQIKHILLVE